MSNLENFLALSMQKILPHCIFKHLPGIYYIINKYRFRIFKRVIMYKETSKARPRRLAEGFFDKYCKGKGIDIGYGGDLLITNCMGWDIENGDAQFLYSISNEQFDFVYSSHMLEHLTDLNLAIENWWRVLKPGGYLILYLPERDLFEKKRTLPSEISLDHKHYFLLDRDDPPDTIGIVPFLSKHLKNHEIVYAKICKGVCANINSRILTSEECSMEIVVKKMKVK